jgi:predicted patatin/cPLA2 family phospholipase
MTYNTATQGHPVIREIIRRRAGGIEGDARAASSRGVKLALVVEGGGMRGVYSGGALVAMERLGLTTLFDEAYGESAGAINACYFLAGQADFGIRIYLDDLTSLKFANPLRIGTILDLNYVDFVMKTVKPLDTKRVLSSPTDLYIAVTSGLTGEPRIFDAKHEGIPLLTLLKATGAIVPLYNHAVTICGHPYVDGGIANPIPVKSAIEAGCTHILVLLTRPPSFVSTGFRRWQRLGMAPLFRKWPPAFVESFYLRQSKRYNETRAIAFGSQNLKHGVHIAVIAPGDDSPPVGRSTMSRKKLFAAQEDAMRRTRALFG